MSLRAEASRSAPPWRHWLAGRTTRTRLVAGLLALFTLASLAVGAVTAVALNDFLIGQLDQQVVTAGAVLIHIEQGARRGPGGGPGPALANPCSTASQPPSAGPDQPPSIAFGQPPGTFAARLAHGRLSYACRVTVSGGVTRLVAVRLPPGDVALLKRLPLDNRPVSGELSGLGDYRLTAFTGRDGDVHLAGLPLAGVQATVARLELIEVIVFGAALLIMGVAGTGLIRLSLRPLDRMAHIAEQVSVLPLGTGEVALTHRVPEADPRTEVGRLGKVLNQMLGHVESALARRQRSEARLRQFAADASHELRTPLAGIRGYTELALRTSADLAPDTLGALRRVQAEAERMSLLVEDLLLLARLDAGRPLAREPVDLTRLALDATNDARVAGPGHHWVLDLPEEPVVVTGDDHRLHQVLGNLLANARTHTPPGTTVTVRLASDGAAAVDHGAELTITDDGPGIPADVQDRVWERFARGDSTRSRDAGSTGLGLAIVHAVVTAHGGRPSMASRPGCTVFRIWLPAASSSPRA